MNTNLFHKTVMVVDDSPSVLQTIKKFLKEAGPAMNVITCDDSRQVMGILSEARVSVLVLDLAMPHIRGDELLEKTTIKFPDLPVIVLTGSVDVNVAVRCMKLGAFDYVLKGNDVDHRLLNIIRHALELKDLARENYELREHMMSGSLENPGAFEEVITNSKRMFSIFQYLEAAAPTAHPILITGETGVGKELIARVIHRLSNRKGEMIPVNAAGLDDAMFSDTLFGHSGGAFTGATGDRGGMIEKAAGSTLFLDEIGDLSQGSQVKLLRLIQNREYLPLGHDRNKKTDARVLAATNRDLLKLREEGKFREDLLYRFKTHHVHIPPLRERTGDIPVLAEHFISEEAKAQNKEKPKAPEGLETLLESYSFPGNVRELKAIIDDAVTQASGGTLPGDMIRSYIINAKGAAREISPFAGMKQLPTLKHADCMLIEEVMKRVGGNQTKASIILGITQPSLNARLKKMKESGWRF